MIPQIRPYEYKPTYAGAPIQEISQSLAMGANEYERNLETDNALQRFKAQLRSLPGDTELLHTELDKAGSALDGLSKQDREAKRYDLARSSTDSMANQLLANPAINAMSESYANFTKAENDKAAMRAKGEVPVEFSDPTKHRSVTADGKVNIYIPHIEAKGNYIADAAQLWSTLAPELLAADLTRSDIDGILQGKTVKGITPQMVNDRLQVVEQAYRTSASGDQQLRVYQRDGAKKPDEKIRNFLLGIGLMKVHKDTDIKYQGDPAYEWEQREKLAEKQAAARLSNAAQLLQMKKALGRPDFNDKSDTYFSPRKTVSVKGVNGKDVSHIIGINAKEISDGLSATLEIPQQDTYEFVGTDTKGLDKKKVRFTANPRVIGIVASNAHGKEYSGGYYATVPYDDGSGKIKMANIIMKNGNEQMSKTVANISRIEDLVTKKKLADNMGYPMDDESGLLAGPLKLLHSAGTGNVNLGLGFTVRPTGDGKSAKVEPTIKRPGKPDKTLTEADALQLGLKTEYSIDDIYKMTQDKLAGATEPYFQTEKSLQNSLTTENP